jgi:hypothetical protein
MRRRIYQLIAGVLIATPLAAEDAVDLNWFEDHVAGKTIHFQRNGAYHGAEQFLDDRRVIWQFSDGTCMPGGYTVEEGAMCFFYAYDPENVQCWDMLEDADGIFARLRGADDTSGDLRITWRTPIPLSCDVAPGGA